MSDTQQGTTGSSVYTGLWVSRCHVPMDDARGCPAGWSVNSLRYTYDVQSTSFSNRQASNHGVVNVSFTPPPPPPRPRACPSGQRCCGSIIGGVCDGSCIPSSRLCE